MDPIIVDKQDFEQEDPPILQKLLVSISPRTTLIVVSAPQFIASA